MKTINVVLVAALCVLSESVWGQTVIQWNLTSNGQVSSSDANIEGDSVKLVNMELSSASTPSAYSSTYGMAVAPRADGKNWNAAFEDTRYVQFSVSVNDDYLFEVSGMSFDIGSYGGNSISVAVYYSLNPDFSDPQPLVPTSNPINQTIILVKNTLYAQSYTISPSLRLLAGQQLYIRFYSMYNTTGARWLLLRNFALQGEVTLAPPMIFPSVSSLTGFLQGLSTPSNVQTYTVQARFLTNDVVVNPPSGFEISTDGATWINSTSSLVLPRNGKILANEPVILYVRMNATTPGMQSGYIEHTSPGAATVRVFVSGVRTAFYYSSANGKLTDLMTWSTDPSGNGTTHPGSFTEDGQTFVIVNRSQATIDTDWEISGSGSKVIVGNGTDDVTFVIPSTARVVGTVDVAARGTLQIQNVSLPELGNLDQQSIIILDGVDGLTLPPHVYGSLVSINDAGKNRILSAGAFVIRGSFVPGSAYYTTTGTTFRFEGTENQTIPSFVYNNLVINSINAQIGGTVEVTGQCTLNENVIVPAGATFVLRQGASVASGKHLVVNGYCKNYDGFPSNALVVNSGGVYEHAVNGGAIPQAQWNDGSTCKITGIIGSSGNDFTGLSGVNQTFSNFTVDCPSLLGKLLLTYNGGSFAVSGTLTIEATGSGLVQIARSSTQNTVTVGRYVQRGGTVYIIHAVSSTGTRALTVAGDFVLSNNAVFGLINGRMSVATNVTGVLSVGGDIEMGGLSRLVRDTARALIVLNGTSKQRVALQNISDTVTVQINNPQGIELQKDLVFVGTLTFVNGKLATNNYTLQVNSVSGASSTSYILTGESGGMRAFVGSAAVVFPVGSPVSYAPVTIQNSGDGDWFTVRVKDDSSGGNGSADRVRLRWSVDEAVNGGSNCTLTLGWMSVAEGVNFAMNRTSYGKIWNLSTLAEAGNGEYTLQQSNEPYTLTTATVLNISDFVIGKDFNSVTKVEQEKENIPAVVALLQNYPNPFNPTTTIEFSVAEKSEAVLKVFDMLGREVETLLQGTSVPGIRYRVPFVAKQYSSGIYFYRLDVHSLESGTTKSFMRKMILMK